jgi:hypothetical protein
MPSLRVPLTTPNGARVKVRIGLSRALVIALRQAAQPIPQSVDVEALLDTGAQCTCLDPSVIAQASLPALGTGFVVAPGTAAVPIPGLGGVSIGSQYSAGLSVLHPSGRATDHLVIPAMPVEVLPLSALGYDALLGRDVLGSCVLVYDGPGGSVTLAY